MQNCPRHVPHADLCRRISRILTLGPGEEVVLLGLLGIHLSQGTSHTKLPNPNTRKNGRHPNRPTTVPPTSIPKAGPSDKPTINTELANPRSLSVKCLPRILQYEGKATDSPSPRITRTTISAVNPCNRAVVAVAVDHRANPAANTHFTS